MAKPEAIRNSRATGLWNKPAEALKGATMFDDYTAAQFLWTAAALFAALAALAAWRDHARAKRRDVDRPGWVPWQAIMVLAMLLGVVSAALAVRV